MPAALGQLYQFYGDRAYAQGQYDCIQSPHVAGVHPLTEVESDENRVMRSVRIAVEWSYGQVTSLWRLSNSHLLNKLEIDAEILLSQVRVMHLLAKCYTCIHGCTVSSHRAFACNPPSLEEYLLLIPDPPQDPFQRDDIHFF